MADVKEIVLSTIEAAIVGEPRSQQKMIGPSELGAACTHCLGAKLAGWEQRREAAWLPYLGTATHAYLEPVFAGPDWLTETRVSVGMVGEFEILGTADLFHIPTGTVVDHKLVGTTTLRKAKGGPTAQYRAQTALYAMGLIRAGYDVNAVAINYLPRNAMSLRQGHWWSEPFNPLIALEALDRAADLMAKIDAFVFIDERDAWISSLPRDPDCFDCSRFPDAPKAVHPKDSLDDLLGLRG